MNLCENCNKKLNGRQRKYCSKRCQKLHERRQRPATPDGNEHRTATVVGGERRHEPFLNRPAVINLNRTTGVLFTWRDRPNDSIIHEDITPSSMDRLMRLIGDTPPAYGWIGGEVVWKLSRTNRQVNHISFDTVPVWEASPHRIKV